MQKIEKKGCGFCHRPATSVLRFKPSDTLTPLCMEHYRLLCRSPNYERTDLTVGVTKMSEEKCGYMRCHKSATKTVKASPHIRYHFCDEHYEQFHKKIEEEFSK